MIKFTAPEDRIIHSILHKVTDKVTDRVTGNVTDKELALIKVILEDPGYTMEEIAHQLSVSRKTIGVWLKGLKEKGIARRIGNTRTGHWEIDEQMLTH